MWDSQIKIYCRLVLTRIILEVLIRSLLNEATSSSSESNPGALCNQYCKKLLPVIFFFRAVLQIVLFGAWTFYQMARPVVVDEGQKPVAPRSVVTWLLVLVANILLSTSQVWSLRTGYQYETQNY